LPDKNTKGDKMTGKLLAGLVIGVFVFVFAGTVQADTTLTSTISMDNGFVVYLSTSDTTAGTSFGAHNNWYTAYNDITTLTAGVDYYLHVYGYDQSGIAGFLGRFTLSGADHSFENNTTTLLTNTTDWKANNDGWTGVYIALPINLGINNGGYSWQPIAGIDTNANWIWSGNAWDNDAAYFSTKISATAVPIPAALPLLGSGLAFLGLLRRRFTK
jgi:hypothetical protein